MHVRVMLASALAALVGGCAQRSAAPDNSANQAIEPWAQTRSNLPDGGPPVDADGLYDAQGSCPGVNGCGVDHWQYFRQTTALYALPNRTAPVVATIAQGEWASVAGMVYRWRPARGVVIDEEMEGVGSNNILNIGDVVYIIDDEGEGYVTLWRRGDHFSWYDIGDGAVRNGIRWDPDDAADRGAGAGWWVQVRRENGQTGWVSGHILECRYRDDPTDATEECNARNAASQ